MKIKTPELKGKPLDWAVLKSLKPEYKTATLTMNVLRGGFNPSTNWSQGGLIIEREKISVVCNPEHNQWEACQRATLNSMFGFNGANLEFGSTPLVAAMRCYVASKLGDEVEIPEELL
jgi:hypothetical protein